MPQQPSSILCVDLDGTLIETNTIFEALLVAMKKNPFRLFPILSSAFQSKAYVKHTIGEYVKNESFTWLYNNKLLAFLRIEHSKGRTLILATASDSTIANAVAKELGIFSEVIASTLEKPINATTKFQVLKERFGEKGFSYAGNSTSDISVWNVATSAIIVHAPNKVTAFIREHSVIEREFPSEKKLRIQDIVQEIRIHQWLKNLLLFVPPIMAHRIGNPETFFHTLVGFFSFSLLASSMYVMNDLLDIQADRAHQTKRFRPIALGTISALQAIILAVCVALGSFIFALSLLPLAFSAMLVLYIVINAVYSFRAKKIPYIDISILAGLYVLRIIAGSAATGITTSSWLFFFAGFFFFFLASMKRVIELLQLKQREDMAPGRGYSKRDTELLVALGMTSSLLACIVLGLYMRSESVTHLYTNPKMLWTILPLLTIWIVRMWYLTLTKKMPDDPVLFTSKDIVSYGIGTAIVGVLIIAGQ